MDNTNPRLEIKIGSLNIQGSLPLKSSYPDFLKLAQSLDFLLIQESWLKHKEKVFVPNFSHFKANRKQNKKARRGSGGLILFYKNVLQKGVTREKSSDEKHSIWIKCDKNFFNLSQDLYLASVYYPPQNSSSNKPNIHESIFNNLQKDTNKYQSKGDVLILGDFNQGLSKVLVSTHGEGVKIKKHTRL